MTLFKVLKSRSKIYLMVIFATLDIMAFAARPIDTLRRSDIEFLTSPEAARIGEQVLAYQRATGGWPKNIDMCRPHTQEEIEAVLSDRNRSDDSTTDNFATTTQMTFMANMFQATHDDRYRDAFVSGIEYLLSGQYDNGGWPQFWPNPEGYQVHITFNDGAMVNTLILLRDVADQKYPYDGSLVDDAVLVRTGKAFDKGIECILASQIRVDGKLTVWCQQHDRETYAPAPARSYELPSFCSQESAQIVNLLMQLPDPDDKIKAAVHGAMKWFEANKLTGYRIERTGTPKTPEADARLVADKNAGPLWGRFYDLDNCEIFVCDRDGIPRKSLEEIGQERRTGYSWYNSYPADLYSVYDAWAARYDPAGKVDLDSISLR
ncbi:MAG: pectate lyase [Muribaculaceae bacterium]|nr:pectate lyase [Muribaculaceae bacterium]